MASNERLAVGAVLTIASAQVVRTHRWKMQHVDTLLGHWHGLSPRNTEKLILSIDNAAHEYRLARRSADAETRNEGNKRMKAIARTGFELLDLLGLRDPETAVRKRGRLFGRLHSVTTELSLAMAVQAAGKRGEVKVSRGDRLITLVMSLTALATAADRIVKSRNERPAPAQRRGGTRRRGPTPEGRLVQRALMAYAAVQGTFRRGPALRWGPPLVGFVRAVVTLVTDTVPMPGDPTIPADLSLRLTDDAIRGHFNRLPAQIKRRRAKI